MAQFCDFELQIRAAKAGGPDYYIDVNSSAGPAIGEMRLDLMEPELAGLSSQVMGSNESLAEREKFGNLLFDKAMGSIPAIAKVWTGSRTIAEAGGQRLRLLLRLEAPELAELPWELIRDTDFLAASGNVMVARYLPNAEPAAPLVTAEKVKVLVIIEQPADPPIDPQVVSRLQSALENSAVFESTVLKNPAIADINNQLWKGHDIVHYMGHGASDRLLFVDGKDTAIKQATEFAALFNGQGNVRLIVLNVCASAQTAGRGLFTGLGPLLAEKRIPAVVAMQYDRVGQTTAAAFNESFYKALAQPFPVDVAVNAARQALRGGQQGTRDWSTPVLYMSTRNGEILNLVDKESVKPRKVRIALAAAPELQEAYGELIGAVERFEKSAAEVTDRLRLRNAVYDLREQARTTLRPALENRGLTALLHAAQAGWTAVRNNSLPANSRLAAHAGLDGAAWWQTLIGSARDADEALRGMNYGDLDDAATAIETAASQGLAEIEETATQSLQDSRTEAMQILARLKPR